MGDSKETGSIRSDSRTKSANNKPAHRSTRNTLLYIGSVVILILVVVTFVGVPAVGGFGQPSGRIIFGRYNGEEIAYRPGNYFARQYETIAQSLRDTHGELDLELQLRIAWRQAFNRAIMRTALLQQGDRSDLRVSEARVDELIAQDPRFMQNGRFNSAAYRALGNQEQFALRTLHQESERFDLIAEDLLGGSRASSREASFIASMAGPERSFHIVRFPFSGFPDQQIAEYAKTNRDLFSELNLSVITLATREEGQQILTRARQGTTPFEELARTYSRDLFADQNGEIGRIWGYEVQQELLNPQDLTAITTMDEGDLSDLVETTSGWSFYRADEAPAQFSTDDTRLLQEARDYMQMFEQGKIQDFVRDEAEAFAVASREGLLEGVAREWGKEIHETPFLPINYGNLQLFTPWNVPDVPDLAEAASREDLLITAFSLEEGAVSEPVMLRRSAIVLSLREERQVDPEDVSFLADAYDMILRQFLMDDVSSSYVKEELLDDFFQEAFNRYVLGNT
ncbi:Parvulin-like peptidyl-prolyl isomerase [Alkalispirochaeta americana]|uniref:Periplasmic chaperone PpiD n=1 Tax=Alkalispirochaeta americana TaxID=159291 RepID=A0A1N6UI12_9SPIO|nr:SurA N-terminal domain-containing protein [Alkalispirochaeta americana]SIQ65259.1 Parvulin-like peptidyl-prolyl isomerase [Alkalispirochaeta americana]